MASAAHKGNRTKWLTIRVLPSEYDQVVSGFKSTTCRKLSEYVRNLVLGKKVTVLYRNQSLDTLMEEMILLRKELNAIGVNLNQVARKINGCHTDRELKAMAPVNNVVQHRLLVKIEEIKKRISEISDLWLQDS